MSGSCTKNVHCAISRVLDQGQTVFDGEIDNFREIEHSELQHFGRDRVTDNGVSSNYAARTAYLAHPCFQKDRMRGDAWLAQTVEHMTLDLGVVSSRPMLDVRIT